MKKTLYILLVFTVLLGNVSSVVAQQRKPQTSQVDKKKAAEQKKKAAAKAKAQKAKEAEKRKKAAEKAKAAAEKQQAALKANSEKQAAQQKRQAEQAKALAERQKAAAEKEAAAEKMRQAYYKQQQELANPTEKPVHYINIAPRIGYAAMMDKNTVKDLNSKLLGGVGAGLGFNYNLEYKHFLFETGLDLEFLNSASRYAYDLTRTDNNYGAVYHYLADDKLKETRNLLNIGLPVMFGAEFSNIYFLVGARVGYDLMGNFSQKGQYDVVVNDPNFLEPYGLGIHDIPAPANKKLSWKAPDVKVCAEIGLDLDQWLQQQPDKEKQKKNKVKPGERIPFGREHVHYRVGLFAEYGVLNTNNNATTGNASMPLNFADNDFKAQSTNSLLAMEGTKLNNLFVGVKFAIQFEIPGKTPAKVPAPPSYADIRITDQATGEVMTTSMARIINDANGREQMKQKQLPKGTQRQKLNLGKYTLEVQADGYYSQTLAFSIDSVDQLRKLNIALVKIPEPVVEEIIPEVIEKGEVFVVKNLYFATNKTKILPISEPAMQELADYLNRHADIRVKIIGHTDNIGRDKANMKLSEGRAKAVKESLIEHGIAAERLESEGRGETQPIDTNDTDEGRQNNRRVEIEIL